MIYYHKFVTLEKKKLNCQMPSSKSVQKPKLKHFVQKLRFNFMKRLIFQRVVELKSVQRAEREISIKLNDTLGARKT